MSSTYDGRVEAALDAYAQTFNRARDEADLTDLLADAMHALGEQAVHDAFNRAAIHHTAELLADDS